jgi:hypothetical protein
MSHLSSKGVGSGSSEDKPESDRLIQVGYTPSIRKDSPYMPYEENNGESLWKYLLEYYQFKITPDSSNNSAAL